MGREEAERAYNLAQAARSGDLNQGFVGGERMSIDEQELNNALATLGRMTAPSPILNSPKQFAGKKSAAVVKAKAQGNELNGMPVKYTADGGVAYDLEKIGADLGMSPEEIQGAYIDIGKRALSPENALRNLGPGMNTLAGGAGDLEEGRRNQWNASISSLSKGQAVLNNIANISPLENIDFTNKDVLANLAKPGFLADRPGNLKSLVNQGQGPRGAGAWARYVVPALGAIVLGGGIASQFGAFGAGSTLTGGASGAGFGGSTVAGSGGLSGGAIAAKGGAIGAAGAGGSGAIGAGGAINAIQSGALASGAGNALNTAAGVGTAAGAGGAGTVAGSGGLSGGAINALNTATGAGTMSGISWDTILGVGGSLVSGAIGYVGAGKAADATSDAAKYAADVAWKMYEQGRADLAPWTQAGGQAVQDLAGKVAAGPGEFTESPGYQFTLQQGLNAQQNALSAMGQNRSGKHIKSATQYAEGLASTEFDNFLNRWYQSLKPLQSLAGLGQTSAIQTAGMGANTAANVGNANTAAGQAQGAGYINQANALTGAITGGANNLLYLNGMRNLPQTNNPYGRP